MTLQPGKQIIAIHILPNISRSKCNQAMKLGQLTDIYYTQRCRLTGKLAVLGATGQKNVLKNFSSKSSPINL